jgi:hypothetical protein
VQSCLAPVRYRKRQFANEFAARIWTCLCSSDAFILQYSDYHAPVFSLPLCAVVRSYLFAGAHSYDKIYREDILDHAYALVKANQGAAGVDGQTFEAIESQGSEKWLEGIRKDLRDKTYKPQPVRRVVIPKPGG